MSATEQFKCIADTLGSLGALTEHRFLEIGRSLEQAIDILGRLATAFDTLLDELRGPALAQAQQDLVQAAAQITAFAGRQRQEAATLASLADTVASVRGRVAAMPVTLREVDMLAVNARLVAAGIGELGAGFLPFSDEIRRSAAAAHVSVQQLAQELATAGQHLQAASAGAADFAQSHAGAMHNIPARLTASADAMEGRGRLAAGVLATVSSRSSDIGRHVAEAIVALQLGDITRQRIEHIQRASRILGEMRAAPEETAATQSLGGRLLAAQLLDTAEALDRDTEHVARQLRALAEDARKIAGLGGQASGTSGQGRGSFLGELEIEVRHAQALFADLHAARADVDQRIATVSRAAQRLVLHMAKLRDMEADIHIIGLNTTLKCNRLGQVGRPLGVIAQALRNCGGRTATDAAAVQAALQPLLAAADALAAEGREHGAATIGDVASRMIAAVRHLSDTGRRLSNAMAELNGDSDAVADLLAAALECFTVRHEISAVLRAAAADCDSQAAESNAPDDMGFEASQAPTLLLIAEAYTMARERDVHARFAPLPGSNPAPTAEPELADVLF